MDLTSGAPFWIVNDGLLGVYPPLREDVRCDVVILGGGITGALVADRFAEAGVECVVIDRREIGHGSTGATTALIQYELDTQLWDLIGRVGEPAATRAYVLCADAVRRIESLATELGQRGDFQPRKSLYLCHARRECDRFRREAELRRRLGLGVEYLDERDIGRRFSFTRPAALLSAPAGEVDAYKLTHRLLGRAVGRGARVYDRTEVRRLETARTGATLITREGFRVRARKIVFATGYETPEWVELDRGLVRLKSTFALATAPLPTFDGWGEDRCLIWESARPYFYARTTGDGRAIVGGEDLPSARAHADPRLLARQTRRLRAKFARMFPRIPIEVDWSWAGVFAETADGLPYIGRWPGFPRGYFALGYGGNGITFGAVAADLLLDLHRGRRNADLKVFAFDR